MRTCLCRFFHLHKLQNMITCTSVPISHTHMILYLYPQPLIERKYPKCNSTQNKNSKMHSFGSTNNDLFTNAFRMPRSCLLFSPFFGFLLSLVLGSGFVDSFTIQYNHNCCEYWICVVKKIGKTHEGTDANTSQKMMNKCGEK